MSLKTNDDDAEESKELGFMEAVGGLYTKQHNIW